MALRHVILTLLEAGPASGYDLQKAFETEVGYFWSASHQQVYRDLGKLADAGLVRFSVVPQSGKPDRKVYELTEAGRAALLAWIESPVPPRKLHDEFMVRLMAGELVGSVALRSILRDQMALRGARLAEYRTIEARHFGGVDPASLPMMQRLALMRLRLGIRGEEAWLDWAQELDSVLDAPDSPPS